MKKIHVIGGFNLLNGAYTLPMLVDYELDNNQILKIKGKKVISLSQCGIKLPASMIGIIDDEVELEIDFILKKKSSYYDIAKEVYCFY